MTYVYALMYGAVVVVLAIFFHTLFEVWRRR